jgi:4-hydroxyacetophenone monooxygenase
MFTRYVEEQLKDRPDLLEKALPDFPPFGKRILLDNGWYSTLKRDNVTLLTEGVTAVDATGLVGSSGDHVDTDVIIWATGFNASYFLDSLEVRGAHGTHLREIWHEDDPKAYLGVSIPNFPNFFMLGGPHSFPGSGSFMYFMEVQMRYLRDLIGGMLTQGVTAIDAKEDVTERYNEMVDEVHSRTVWTHPGFGTYYRNSKGRVIFVMPFLNLEYWEFTRRSDFENYNLRVREHAEVEAQSA